ncbi:MAG: hypothetical protein GY778_25925 [bacterium]|nr:hypothetical protein [bacterium]
MGMDQDADKSLHDVVKAVGRYPEDAYHFVREGLNYAVERIHGPQSPAQRAVAKYLVERGIDLTELFDELEQGELDAEVASAIEAAGGVEQLNRHVSGQELCWGMRNLALHRWGPLATVVLRGWNVRETVDFGRIVFALIEHDLMQKEPTDRLEDFERVYGFDEAMTESYRIGEDPLDKPSCD